MEDTLNLAKNVANAVGVPSASVALATGNSVLSWMTILSSVIIAAPKLIKIINDIELIISKKKKNVQQKET